MTSKLEHPLQTKCLRWAKAQQGVWIFKVVGSAVQESGVPDTILCVNGKFVAIELKRPDGEGVVSDIQVAQIDRIHRAGGVAEVVDSFQDFKDIVEHYLHHGTLQPTGL